MKSFRRVGAVVDASHAALTVLFVSLGGRLYV